MLRGYHSIYCLLHVKNSKQYKLIAHLQLIFFSFVDRVSIIKYLDICLSFDHYIITNSLRVPQTQHLRFLFWSPSFCSLSLPGDSYSSI